MARRARKVENKSIVNEEEISEFDESNESEPEPLYSSAENSKNE